MRPIRWYWYDLKYASARLRADRKLAWMIPESIAYWVFIRVACRREHLCQSPDRVTILDVLRTFDPPPR